VKDASEAGNPVHDFNMTSPMTPPSPAIVVFSHLRWDFVYQRPQQLLSRLARHHPVFFIEEPTWNAHHQHIETYEAAPNVTVCRLHSNIEAGGFHDRQLPLFREMLSTFGQQYPECIAWFYTPMALPLLQELTPRTVVYDCMDQLSAFDYAPRQLLQRETALLKVADVVFTGGGSLYRAKRERHGNVHCFPSSVDASHFQVALQRIDQHPAQVNIRRPRLGYYGVLDERIDFKLIESMALARPEWQIVLVGPTAKIDPGTLPVAGNLHYLGQQDYQDLPQFLAGWDVCLMPFALNASTRYLSPTKILEYMAAELPIVSTPIADIEQPYGDIVAIASNPGSFIDACERALNAGADERERLRARMRAVVQATSWDETVDNMRAVLAAIPVRQVSEAGRALLERGAAEPASEFRKPAQPLGSFGCIVIGAGPTGLSAAYHLDEDCLVVEKNATVGGWCRSISDQGFTFDYAGHIMFSNDPWVLDMYRLLLGDNIHWQDREAWIYSKGVHTRYPFQGALYGLPPKVLKECLIGAIEARFGSIGAAARSRENTIESQCCGEDNSANEMTISGDTSLPDTSAKTGPRNFEEFINRVWGRGVARHFALPYNRKLWTVPLDQIETSWLEGRVPLPDLEQMIEGALEPVARPMGPNARFGYPLRGGFQALMNGFLPHLRGRIECDAQVLRIDPAQRIVLLSDGRRFRYQQLISCMPLPELFKVLGDAAPTDMQGAAAALRHVSVRCVNLGVAREALTEKHWIYYPEETVFHRIFVQGNASPECNPPGGFGLTCEISYSADKPLPCEGTALIERCVADCIKVGMMRADDRLLTSSQTDLPYAYVIYDHARAALVARLRAWLSRLGIVLAGRYAEWEYYNSDHAFVAGKRAAEEIKTNVRSGVASDGDAA